MKENMQTSEAFQRLQDFVWVHYGQKTARSVKRDPDVAICLIREDIEAGIDSPSRLGAYAAALRDAIEVRKV